MTKDNRKKNIVVELRRGNDALEAARILLQAGKLADSVSRAYYAAFHYARALLLTEGLETRTHGGVERLLHRDFVSANKLDAEIAVHLSELMKLRGDADYTAEYVFVRPVAERAVKAADTFTAAVRKVLEDGGWLA